MIKSNEQFEMVQKKKLYFDLNLDFLVNPSILKNPLSATFVTTVFQKKKKKKKKLNRNYI
jgi:hypothetical protein